MQYLHELGISDAYASPILAARPGSNHGYDVCDPTRLNPDLGGDQDFDAFAAALRQRGMGLVLDAVPNHMGIGHPSNLWWYDVLENGPSSIHAAWFDIAWHPVNPNLDNKVLLPILEDQYGTVLEAGKIRLTYETGAFAFYYYDKRLPVEPGTYPVLLRRVLERLIEAGGKDNESVRELQSILTALGYLPARTELDPDKVIERNREKEVIKGRIAALVADSKDVGRAIEEVVRRFNGRAGDTASFDLLDELLDAQSFRPAYWRVATEEINYRRFFDVNELAAICVERPEVFRATHQLYFRLLAEGKATGLRIDHPDGLWDPAAYFRQLQEEYVLARLATAWGRKDRSRVGRRNCAATSARCSPATRTACRTGRCTPWLRRSSPRARNCRCTWTVDGTTGYDFLNLVNGLFVDAANEQTFERIYASFSGATLDFHQLVNFTKKTIMQIAMASEINALSHQLDRISERNRRYRDFTLNSLTFVLREFIACLPVYRTYVTDPQNVAVRDRSFIETAVEEAKQLNPRTAESIFDFVRDTILLRKIQDFREEDRPKLVEWAMRFQQVTGPVMAKGVEDTALYVYNRLASLNEVGGAPNHFGVSLEKFHRVNGERLQTWPHALLATSTHDTKRSEDVRARLNVLSEMPDEWQEALGRWRKLNAPKRTAVDGVLAPDGNDEYVLYQALLGLWPCEPLTEEAYTTFRERLAAYMHKATKEAKVHTSWINANEEYDDAVRNFVFGILPAVGRGSADGTAGNGQTGAFRLPSSAFLQDLLGLQRRVAWYGSFNSLAQVLLKCTCPGVPDFYQGTELWDLSLVDPDNRRPVDYGRRRELLSTLKEWVQRLGEDLTPLTKELLANLSDGRLKLYLTWRALSFRQQQGPLFAEGTYQPLAAVGTKKEHVCAFARRAADTEAVVVAPRLLVGLTSRREQAPMGLAVWQDTWLVLPETSPGQRYRHLFTGEVFAVGDRDGQAGLPLAQVLGNFPVALLTRLAD